MDAFAFPQPTTMGAVFSGLAAQVTGSDAAFDVVADFTGATATQLPAPSVATPVTHTPSATQGSRFHINVEGIWRVKARVHCITAASVRAAIGLDNSAGELAADPPVPNGTTILDLALRIATAADTDPVEVESEDIIITRAMAQADPTLATSGGTIRLLLSNNAGAGAADASISVAICFISFRRIGDIPSQVRG